MVNDKDIIAQDLQHIWHPCMQMKDFEQSPPLVVYHAEGPWLKTNIGTLIDGQSSWWCKSLGHRNPAVTSALKQQIDRFEHVIAANTTHPLLSTFGSMLSDITGLPRLCFGSDGSSAVEIALKLALSAQKHLGRPERSQFLSLENAYHGETMATLAVSDLGIYKDQSSGINNACHFIRNIPYVHSSEDAAWGDADQSWSTIESQLNTLAPKLAALIVEPLVQGAGGMRIYSASFLSQLVRWAKRNDVFVIFDEIMTGIGRTGKWLAMDYVEENADMICLSKGLTAGAVPMSCTAVSEDIYRLFYADYAEGKSFLHSHTHSANALGIAAAVATLRTIEQDNILDNVQLLHEAMKVTMADISKNTGLLTNIRSIGALIAADISNIQHPRPGFILYQQCLKHGALLRSLGKSVYWLPPLNSTTELIEKLGYATQRGLEATEALT